MKKLLPVLLSVVVAIASFGDTKEEQQKPHVIHFLHAPHPDYPRNRSLHGSGIYRIHFDPRTGWATSVDILKSTRSNTLDKLAVECFMKWQCEPGTGHQLTVPLTFNSN